MNPLLKKHIESIEFQEIDLQILSVEKIEHLTKSNGYVLETKNTKLWVLRETTIQYLLGIATVMESVNTYSIMDDFGVTIWRGAADTVLEFVKGFIEG